MDVLDLVPEKALEEFPVVPALQENDEKSVLVVPSFVLFEAGGKDPHSLDLLMELLESHRTQVLSGGFPERKAGRDPGEGRRILRAERFQAPDFVQGFLHRR